MFLKSKEFEVIKQTKQNKKINLQNKFMFSFQLKVMMFNQGQTSDFLN